MNKRLIILLAKSIVFIALLFLIIESLSTLFTEQKQSVWENFYDQKEGSVDVLILGNSHANSGLDIDIINAKLSSNAISLATRGQNIYQSYYCALEAYKYQTPKTLIIENFLFYERLTYEAFVTQDPSINDYMKRYLTYEGKKFGKVKLEESKAFFEGNLLENTFPLLKKHNRWTDVEKFKGRLYNNKKPRKQSGTTVLTEASANQYELQKDFDLKKFNLIPDEKVALEKIITLAKEKGTQQIILLTLPFYSGYRDKIDYNSLDFPIKDFVAKHRHLEYIDLNRIYHNWDRTYFSNDPVGYNQHLNYKGAIVVSNYLAKFMKASKQGISNRSLKSPEDYLYRKKVKDSPNGVNKLIGNLEALNGRSDVKITIKQDDYNGFVLSGWMTLENEQSTFSNEMLVALVKDNDFIYFSNPSELKTKIRKDVSKYFKKESGFYDYSGFKINVLSNLLEKGTYSIYMVFINENNDVFYKPTFKSLQII